MNTLNFTELSAAFSRTVAAFGAEVDRGFKGGRVDKEDGFPWFDVSGGRLSRQNAPEFCQELANAMQCRVLLNSTGSGVVSGVMDFDPDAPRELPMPRTNDEEVDDYGDSFLPQPPRSAPRF